MTLPELEKKQGTEIMTLLTEALLMTDGNIREAAKLLDTSHSRVWRMVQRFKLVGLVKKEWRKAGYKGRGKPATAE